MTKRRKVQPAQFKFKVALEAVKGSEIRNQIASRNKIHPRQVTDWQKQLLERGQNDTLARLAEAISLRDKNDMERDVAPLMAAHDALKIDSTDLTIEQVCNRIISAAAELGMAKSA